MTEQLGLQPGMFGGSEEPCSDVERAGQNKTQAGQKLGGVKTFQGARQEEMRERI